MGDTAYRSASSRGGRAAHPSRAEVLRLLEPVVTSAGYDLEDVQVTPAGKRRRLRVVIDGDGGVGLDAVAEVSHAIAAALDADDAMGALPYVLEVTSPGVDRPLTLPRHWRRAVGRLVEVRPATGEQVLGRLIAADDEAVTVQIGVGERRFTHGELARGLVQVEFDRQQGTLGDS
jgi:ribosome maturation factor RimP